jgi:hypothetical protein
MQEIRRSANDYERYPPPKGDLSESGYCLSVPSNNHRMITFERLYAGVR